MISDWVALLLAVFTFGFGVAGTKFVIEWRRAWRAWYRK